MAKKRPGVMFYFEWIEIVEELTAEEQGKLLMGALIYARTGKAPNFTDRAMRVAWRAMQSHVDADEERYNERVQKGEESANRRWEGKKNEPLTREATARARVEDEADRIFREQDERERRKKERESQ